MGICAAEEVAVEAAGEKHIRVGTRNRGSSRGSVSSRGSIRAGRSSKGSIRGSNISTGSSIRQLHLHRLILCLHFELR